jgi:6-phosphogluconolactonase (cycloisomerase 2 family)
MVVAVYGGGAYNVLPVDADGQIGRVTQVLKEIGCGRDLKMQATAHPHSVVFHSSGKLVVATDFGCDRINVFSFEGGQMTKTQQIAAPAGSGPAEVCLDERRLEALVEHSLGSFRSRYLLEARG